MVLGFVYNNTLNGNGYPMYPQYGYMMPAAYTGFNANDVQNINAQIIQSIRMLAKNLNTARVKQPVSTDWQNDYRKIIRTTPQPQVVSQPREVAEPKAKQNYEIKNYNDSLVTRTLSADFINRVKEISAKVKCDYRDLLGVMNSESGLNPTARNKHSGAIGLIQFTGIAIKDLNQAYGLNLTKDKIAKMSAMEQLDLVEKYLMRAKSYRFKSNETLDSADLYAVVYRPAFAGKNIIARRSDGDTYHLNKGLDLNKDGVISREDLAQAVQRKHINVNLVA